MAAALKLNLFPARAAAGGVVYEPVRAAVVGDWAVIVGVRDGEPVVLRRARLTDPSWVRGARRVTRLDTEDGAWEVSAAGGCGCRHPLKRMSTAAVVAAAAPDA